MAALDSCCGCIPLKTGCLIIGYLYLVSYALLELVCIGGLIYCGVVVASNPNGNASKGEIEQAFGLILGFGIFFIIILSILLTIASLFVAGVHQGRRSFVKVFYVFLIVQLVFSGLGIIGAITSLDIVVILIYVARLVIDIYVFMVVQSYYETMTSGRVYQQNTYVN